MAVLRLYTCYNCNKSFETTTNAPSCRTCNRKLKGKYLSGTSEGSRNNYSSNYRSR